MDLYNLGGVSWWESQCYYHALAYLGREGLIICYPSRPYVCLGLHDDLEQEIDQEYCKAKGIPLLRRETGGGVVYLDHNQIFFQLVLRRDNPVVPLRRHHFYERFLRPPIAIYRDFGMPAVLKDPADIMVDGRKCSGNASGDIDRCVAYVGNIIVDFDFETMCRVLQVSGNIYRRYLQDAMQNYMTMLADWCAPPTNRELVAMLVDGFAREWGPLSPRTPDAQLLKMAGQLRARLSSPEWLSSLGHRLPERKIKIAEGVYLMERKLVGQGRLVLVVREGKITNLVVIGEGQVNQKELQRYLGCEWKEELLAELSL